MLTQSVIIVFITLQNQSAPSQMTMLTQTYQTFQIRQVISAVFMRADMHAIK